MKIALRSSLEILSKPREESPAASCVEGELDSCPGPPNASACSGFSTQKGTYPLGCRLNLPMHHFSPPCESEPSLLQFIKVGVLDCHLSKFKQGHETNDSEVTVQSIYGE